MKRSEQDRWHWRVMMDGWMVYNSYFEASNVHPYHGTIYG